MGAHPIIGFGPEVSAALKPAPTTIVILFLVAIPEHSSPDRDSAATVAFIPDAYARCLRRRAAAKRPIDFVAEAGAMLGSRRP